MEPARPELRLSDLANPAGALTLARLPLAVAIPFVIGAPPLALGLYVAGLLTDVADGFVARRTHTASQAGATLDGVLDKVLHVTTGLSLVAARIIPWWWVFVWFARDLIQLGMAPWVVGPWARGELGPRGASVLGKATSATLAAAVIASLLGWMGPAAALTWLTGVLGVATGAGYLRRELEDLRTRR